MKSKEIDKPRSIAEQRRDRKVVWGTPKRCFVLASLDSNDDYRRLRQWIEKGATLEMLTSEPHRELVIINREMLDAHKQLDNIHV